MDNHRHEYRALRGQGDHSDGFASDAPGSSFTTNCDSVLPAGSRCAVTIAPGFAPTAAPLSAPSPTTLRVRAKKPAPRSATDQHAISAASRDASTFRSTTGCGPASPGKSAIDHDGYYVPVSFTELQHLLASLTQPRSRHSLCAHSLELVSSRSHLSK